MLAYLRRDIQICIYLRHDSALLGPWIAMRMISIEPSLLSIGESIRILEHQGRGVLKAEQRLDHSRRFIRTCFLFLCYDIPVPFQVRKSLVQGRNVKVR